MHGRTIRIGGAAPNEARNRQRGAVLLVALVILVVLTLLGVSTMNSTQLEEKMAANNQELTRAFHAAESGLSEAFNNNTTWTISVTAPVPYVVPTDQDGEDLKKPISVTQAETSTTFLGFSPPPPASMYSATSFQAANFDFQSDSCTNPDVSDDGGAAGIVDECTAASALTVTVHGGAYQIAPKND